MSVANVQTLGPTPSTGKGIGHQGQSYHDHWGQECDCSSFSPEQEAADTSTNHSTVERYLASLGGAREVVPHGGMIVASVVRLTGYQLQLWHLLPNICGQVL